MMPKRIARPRIRQKALRDAKAWPKTSKSTKARELTHPPMSTKSTRATRKTKTAAEAERKDLEEHRDDQATESGSAEAEHKDLKFRMLPKLSTKTSKSTAATKAPKCRC
eukprot:55248-Amphidinium_carterae.1